MSPYASIALLALVLSVAAQNVQKTTVNTNVNWNKQTNSAVGNVNVNGKSTPFTVSISGNPNQQPTFTIQSQNPAGKTTTVKIIPIKPIVSSLPPQAGAEPPKPGHQEIPVPVPQAAPPKPVHKDHGPAPQTTPVAGQPAQPVVTVVRTSTFATSEPGKPTVAVRQQTITHSNDPTNPVTFTVVSVSKPASEPVKAEPGQVEPAQPSGRHPTVNVAQTVPAPMPTFVPIPTNAPVPMPVPVPMPMPNSEPVQVMRSPVNCEHPDYRDHEDCRGSTHGERRRGCNRRLWIKGCILGLAAFGALAFLALCCRICRGGRCCRRCHRECERNPAYGIPAPVPMPAVGQPQVIVVQAQPVNDPYFQPTPTNTNRSNQPFVQLNETHPDTSANYVIGYPQPHEQPIYMVPQRN